MRPELQWYLCGMSTGYSGAPTGNIGALSLERDTLSHAQACDNVVLYSSPSRRMHWVSGFELHILVFMHCDAGEWK